jgi:hypothetical protein
MEWIPGKGEKFKAFDKETGVEAVVNRPFTAVEGKDNYILASDGMKNKRIFYKYIWRFVTSYL